jgi:hypothetical protein
MSDFNSLPAEPAPLVTDKIFTARGAAAGAERQPTIAQVLAIFGLALVGGALRIQRDTFFVQSTDGSVDVFSASDEAFSLKVPLAEEVFSLTDGESPVLLATAMVVDYRRSDGLPITAVNPGDAVAGQHLTVTNSSVGPVAISCVAANSFYDGASATESMVLIAASETVQFILINNQWRVISKYPAP